VDIASFARGHAVAVRIPVNLIYVALLVWSITQGHWPYGLIIVPFLAYGTWRLWVLLRRFRVRTQGHDTASTQPPEETNW
jgi:fatty acid desaturase